jgi:hypothetical protein
MAYLVNVFHNITAPPHIAAHVTHAWRHLGKERKHKGTTVSCSRWSGLWGLLKIRIGYKICYVFLHEFCLENFSINRNIYQNALHYRTSLTPNWNLFYVTDVCTPHVSTNIHHFQVPLKFLMKLLCFHPQVHVLGYALLYAPMCVRSKFISNFSDIWSWPMLVEHVVWIHER